MKILHIYRSQPDELVRNLAAAVSEGQESSEERLYEGKTDFDGLLAEIFASSKVVSWW